MAKIVKPTDSYASNQFYRLNRTGDVAGPGGLRQGGRFADNPTNDQFAYPGGHRRHLNADGEMVAHHIERGFMRILPYSLERERGDDKSNLPNYRLFFQFNPQTINREVRMSENTYSPIMQTKEQLSQPLYGESTFSFDLMFDRSFELNSSISNRDQLNEIQSDLAQADTNDSLTTLSPQAIGVLHDIRMLDAVVGQGITQEMVTFIANRYAIYDRLQASKEEEGVTTETDEDGNTIVTTEGQPGTPTTITEALKANVGNQAFLLPNPVRVVFSSLFMVDGFVNSMAVRYVKFNTNMVPMTALINVQMNAVYFGFARANTAFTDALRQADLASIESSSSSVLDSVSPTNESERFLKTLFDENLSAFYIHVGGTYSGDPLTGAGSDTPALWGQTEKLAFQDSKDSETYSGDGSTIAAHKVIGFTEDNLLLACGFPKISNEKDEDGFWVDPIYKALRDGTLSSVQLSNFYLKVTRTPFTGREKEPPEDSEPYDPVMMSVIWDASSLDKEGFSASGANAPSLWEQAQHQKDEGGGTMKATRERRAANGTEDRMFLDSEEDWERFKTGGGSFTIEAGVTVILTHGDGTTKWKRNLKKVEPPKGWWRNILITINSNPRSQSSTTLPRQ